MANAIDTMNGNTWSTLFPIFRKTALARMTGSPDAPTCGFHLTGQPGTAKSAFARAVYDDVVEEVAAFHKVSPGEIPFVGMMAPLLDPMDTRGLPVTVTENGKTHTIWARPGESIMPLEGRPAAFMFIDEIDKAPTAVRNTLYQGPYEGRFGEHLFPSNTFFALASNLVTDRAGGTSMEMHGRNRMLHFRMVMDLDAVLAYFGGKGYAPWLLGFLKDFPDFMYKFNPKADTLAFPTLRSWEFFGQMLRIHGEGLMHIWGPGAVGDEATAKAKAYFDLVGTMPKWQEIRAMAPADAVIHVRQLPASVQYAAVTMFAANVTTKDDVDWMIETCEKVSPDYAHMAYTWLTQTYKAKAALAWTAPKAQRFHATVGLQLHKA